MVHNFVRKPKDFWSSLFFIVAGLGTCAFAQGYGIGTTRQMGAGYFPLVLGALLALLGAVILVRSLLGEAEAAPRLYLRQGFFVLLGMLVFGLLIRAVGLPGSILLMVLIGTFASDEYRASDAAIVGAALAALTTLVFVFLLGQPIPVLGWAFGG